MKMENLFVFKLLFFVYAHNITLKVVWKNILSKQLHFYFKFKLLPFNE